MMFVYIFQYESESRHDADSDDEIEREIVPVRSTKSIWVRWKMLARQGLM